MSKLRSISTGGLLLAMLVVNCKCPYSGPSTQKTSTKKSSADEAKKVPQKLEEQKQVEPKEELAATTKKHEAKPENPSEPKVESATSSQEVPRTSTKTSADEAKKVPQKLEEQKQVEPKVESATSSQKVPETAQKSQLSDPEKPIESHPLPSSTSLSSYESEEFEEASQDRDTTKPEGLLKRLQRLIFRRK